jgi:hypothetical protein
MARLFVIHSTLRAPQFHGADWCFDCRVAPDFYQREGRTLLRSMRARLLAPLPFEVAIGALLAWRGLWAQALCVEIAVHIASPFYHTAVLRAKAKQAWQYAIFDEPPASSVVASLNPRKLADYDRRWLEWTLHGAMALSVVLLAFAFTQPNAMRHLNRLLLVPCVGLYAWPGLSLAKRAVVDWRVSITPAVHPELFTEWQDAGRRLFLMMCDYLRALTVTFLLGWSVMQAWPDLWKWRLYVFLGPCLAVALCGAIPLFLAERHFVTLARNLKTVTTRWRPAPAPPPEGRFYLAGRLCFEREEEKVIVRGPRGLALNAASRRTRIYAAYLAGWPAMAAVIVIWRG